MFEIFHLSNLAPNKLKMAAVRRMHSIFTIFDPTAVAKSFAPLLKAAKIHPFLAKIDQCRTESIVSHHACQKKHCHDSFGQTERLL
jgi:hypothetical protein